MKRLQELFVTYTLRVSDLAAPLALRAQVPPEPVCMEPSPIRQAHSCPKALVQLRGPGGEQRRTTDTSGQLQVSRPG